jgi:hypothetical protein
MCCIMRKFPIASALVLCAAATAADDTGYTAKIREYTTERFFLTELVDHLPASAKVPSPEKTLGYAIGTPGKLTYTKDIYRYMRELEKATPRVKVFSIGRSEEDREFLLVAVSDEANLRRLDRLKQISAALADPRQTAQPEADKLIAEAVPMYWATGSIHSPETGSPEMLMELAYRLAVEDTPLIENIRRNLVVLITPVVEVDGRDKMVDTYNYRKTYPDRAAPNLVYWGRYVAHDNNRDGMVLTLALSRTIMNTFLDYHPQVLHDLHESVPFLYTSTGMGPYNPWLDPMVVSEWQKMAYHEIEEMTRRGVPGVWTHGFYDGWAANYMFYAANGHNSIGRFYETFGNRGADTAERTVPRAQTTRTWFRPNPPLEKVKWSLRNNVNLQQSALLLAMNYTASNGKTFLSNFYTKSRRSIEKALMEGPAAWVLPSDDPRPATAAELVQLLQRQGVEVHRADAVIEIGKQKFPAGSYVVRMDQPYSRMADMLLDTQYYNVADPRPYDDTGWSLGALRNVSTVRVTDAAILKAPMTLLNSAPRPGGGVTGDGSVFLINHNTDNVLATLRFRLGDVKINVAEVPFEAGGRKYAAGSFLIASDGNARDLRPRIAKEASELGIQVHAVPRTPDVRMHPLAKPRIALVHTWINTQDEGWFRIAFDKLAIPYTYISDQNLRAIPDLRSRFDVILFGPVRAAAQRIVNGLPKYGPDPIPWKKSDVTPNLGMSPDQTEDMRGGLGLDGVAKLQKFVEDGGLFITIAENASLPINFGVVDGVTITPARELQVRGSVLNAAIADKSSPITYGYGDKLAVYFNQAPIFAISRNGGFTQQEAIPSSRASGRGTPTDPDIPQGRPYVAPPPRPEVRPGDEPPLDAFDREMMRGYLPPPELQPRVILRFADEKELLVSGMLAGGRELANRPAIVDVPRGRGHVLLFATNPMWRDETHGSYFLLFNAMLNYDHLSIPRASPAAVIPSGAEN